jgi:hypothetical protein
MSASGEAQNTHWSFVESGSYHNIDSESESGGAGILRAPGAGGLGGPYVIVSTLKAPPATDTDKTWTIHYDDLSDTCRFESRTAGRFMYHEANGDVTHIAALETDNRSVWEAMPLSEPLQVALDSTDVSCAGIDDGMVSVSVTGGIGPYTYLWSTGETTEAIDNLAVGIYSVTVTDALNETITDSTDINADPDFDLDGIGDACDACINFVIIGEKEASINESTVWNGGIAVTQSNEIAEINNNSMVIAAGTFVIAPQIDISGGSQVTTTINEPAVACLPPFLSNPYSGGSGVEVEEGETVVLTDSVYEEIKIQENATVIFSGQSIVYIEGFEADENVTIQFDQCTDLVVGSFKLGKKINFNPTNQNVGVFAEKKITITGESTVRGLFYSLKDIKIKKGKSNNRNQLYGQFIGEKVKVEEYSDLYYQDYSPCLGTSNSSYVTTGSETDISTFVNTSSETVENIKRGVSPQVDNPSQVQKLKLFPNPANQKVTLLLERKLEKNALIQIFNVQGQLVFQQQINEDFGRRKEVVVNTLKNGLYYLVLTEDGLAPQSKKLMIQR